MLYDCVISSKLSNKLIRSQKNYVDHFVDIGPIFTEIKKISNKEDLLRRLNIGNDSKIISFFDNTFGDTGVISTKSYMQFLSSIDNIKDNYKDFKIIFKSKKSISQLQRQNKKISYLVSELEKNEQIIYANNYDLNTFEIFAISELVICVPFSSILYEALASQTKSICFDPLKQYYNFKILPNKFNNLMAHSMADLLKITEYWLNEVTHSEFIEFLNNNISQYIDVDLNQSSFKKYNDFISKKILQYEEKFY